MGLRKYDSLVRRCVLFLIVTRVYVICLTKFLSKAAVTRPEDSQNSGGGKLAKSGVFEVVNLCPQMHGTEIHHFHSAVH
jgi:hypothetical protein